MCAWHPPSVLHRGPVCHSHGSIFLFVHLSISPSFFLSLILFVFHHNNPSSSPSLCFLPLSSFPFIVLSTLAVIFISNKPPPTLISFLLFSFIQYSRLSLPVSHFYVRPLFFTFLFLVCFLSLPPFSYSLFIICRICPSFLVGSVTSLSPILPCVLSLLPLPSPFLGAPALLLV